MKAQNLHKNVKWFLMTVWFLIIGNSSHAQAPADPFAIYNNTNCDIIVYVEYWDDSCSPGLPCYVSPVGGNAISPGSKFNLPVGTCAPLAPDDVHVVLMEVDGQPVTSSPNDVGYMGNNCINSSGANASGSYPVGATCKGTWNMVYNGPNNVTIW